MYGHDGAVIQSRDLVDDAPLFRLCFCSKLARAGRNCIKGSTRLQGRGTRRRGAQTLRLLVMAAAVLTFGVVLAACGSGADGGAGGSAPPAATTAATPLQTYLDALKPALAAAAKAGEAEFAGNNALGAREHAAAVQSFREAARLYGETAAIMDRITVPSGLEATRQLAAAQHDYADALDHFTDSLDSGARLSQTRSQLVALFAVGKRYDLALRRYNRALIVTSADQGITPSPWLAHPFFSSAVRGR
jgi:tetratricopeptide (TPR) repeat protein